MAGLLRRGLAESSPANDAGVSHGRRLPIPRTNARAGWITCSRPICAKSIPARRRIGGRWLTRHPEFFDELSDFFADRDQLEQITGPLRDIVGASDRLLALEGLDPPTHPETSRPDRRLRGDRLARSGRDGRGLQGVRRDAEPVRRDQVAGAAVVGRCRSPTPIHARGPGGRGHQPSPRGDDPRRRRVARAPVPRDGVYQRLIAPGAARRERTRSS